MSIMSSESRVPGPPSGINIPLSGQDTDARMRKRMVEESSFARPSHRAHVPVLVLAPNPLEVFPNKPPPVFPVVPPPNAEGVEPKPR